MKNVYIALLDECTGGKLSFSDLFKASAGVQSNMTKTGYTVASVAESRKFVFGDLQAIKNSTNLPLKLSFGTFDTKAEAVSDLSTNLDSYYPNI